MIIRNIIAITIGSFLGLVIIFTCPWWWQRRLLPCDTGNDAELRLYRQHRLDALLHAAKADAASPSRLSRRHLTTSAVSPSQTLTPSAPQPRLTLKAKIGFCLG